MKVSTTTPIPLTVEDAVIHKMTVISPTDTQLEVVEGETVTFSADSYIDIRHSSEIDDYTGQYIVIPGTADITLKTAQKRMLDNVTIQEIPTYQTANEKGTTFIIGS